MAASAPQTGDTGSVPWVTILVLLTAILSAIGVGIRALLYPSGHEPIQGTIALLLLGLALVCFVRLGRTRACDAALLAIELAVHAGGLNRLLNAIGNLSYYGHFREVLDDGRRIIARHD